jgi:hypothetical protein
MTMNYSFYLTLEHSRLRETIQRILSDPLDISERLGAYKRAGLNELVYRRPETRTQVQTPYANSSTNPLAHLEQLIQKIEGNPVSNYKNETTKIRIDSAEHEDYYCIVGLYRLFKISKWFYAINIELPVSTSRNLKNIDFYLPLLEKLVEVIQPYHGFSTTDITENDYLNIDSSTTRMPWEFYWDTMIFGPELVQQKGLRVFESLPAYYKTSLKGGLYWISDINRLGNEGPNDTLDPSAQWKKHLKSLGEAVGEKNAENISDFWGEKGLVNRQAVGTALGLDWLW